MSPAALVGVVIGVVFVAAFVRSALGFGDAVIAMPLLAMAVGVKTAAPLVAFLGPAIALLILGGNRRAVDLKAAFRLVLASLLGIPVGICALTRLPEGPLRIALGIIIMIYGVFGLMKPQLRVRHEGGGDPWLVGFVAGVLGGAYNTNGPPVVAYGMLRGWPPDRFRATLQGYFLPTGLVILGGHGLAGLWTAEVLKLFGAALPALALGVYLGGKLNRRLTRERFSRLVYALLALAGALLVFRLFLLKD